MFKTLQGLTRPFPGKWIYEVLISSQGLMQIGWCTINCRFNQEVPVERGPAQALAGLRQPPAQWGPLRTLTWTALWRRTVSHPIPGHRSPETALVPSLGASAPFSRAMWVQGWCLAGSGPAPPRSPDLTDGFSLGGGWRYTQLLRLRRQPGTQVERDHDELRKGEATSPTATCPLPLPRLSAGLVGCRPWGRAESDTTGIQMLPGQPTEDPCSAVFCQPVFFRGSCHDGNASNISASSEFVTDPSLCQTGSK